MWTADQLREQLRDLDGRGYRAYRALGPIYAFDGFHLRVDHVQGDPYADPTRLSALVAPADARLPPDALASRTARVAAADYLNRRLLEELTTRSRDRGSGRSGELSILRPGQEILHRTSLFVHEDGSIEARFRAGLPARGRTVLGKEAAILLCDELPDAIRAGLLADRSTDPLLRHVQAAEDAQALRAQLPAHGLVAFVADGSILPRRSGVDDRPLEGAGIVPFVSPDSLRVTLSTPHSGAITGMGVREGITLFAGGGFHGKSTLLRAIERGIYDHIPGDGRERVVSRGDVLKVRAEGGRSVAGTDISSFIDNLPGGEDTVRFTSANASGSTSQAAAIAEGLEVGCRCLLMDEDTSASNLLVRDARMQALVAAGDEPITPFIDHVAELRRRGISVLLVIGGAGDYFDVADTVIVMRRYQPRDATAEAKRIAAELPSRRTEASVRWREPRPRVPIPASIDPARGNREVEVRVYGTHRMTFGTQEVDLAAVEQLVEGAQAAAIGRTLAWARGRFLDGARTLSSATELIMKALEEGGLDRIDERRSGEYAAFRGLELAAVLNRLRGLRTL